MLNYLRLKMKKYIIVSVIFYWKILFSCNALPNILNLELLQVLVRHSERYPDVSEKNLVGPDSYDYYFQNFDEFGELTKVGKSRAYNFGKTLRQMYDFWLGEFRYKEVYARSTDYDRTKATLLLILAGLYPPTPQASWSNELNWSPIPTHYYPVKNDLFLVTKNPACGIRKLGIDSLPYVTERMQPYQDFYEELKTKTKIDNNKPITFSRLYAYVQSLLAMGLALPNWCSPDDFRKLEEITKIHYESLGLTPASRKALAGSMVDLILGNINNNQNSQRKLYLYSIHDVNIASFIQAHNATGIPTIPEYGSAIIINSYRGDDGQVYLSMVYWTGVSAQLLPIQINGGEQMISLDSYTEIVRPMIPNDEEKSCYLPKQ